ncbi:winged helix-turn-helix transcriptional regulator [Mycobacterium shigaense]|uniref:Putative transcriptional regulator n=1 Tax=Mycobacterium shigaense TaxID=722731 RepID=A0A1Z4EI74_9MYCO|nr:helix-turn-helix domain-containing protein [Mycobacterium shigaense]MEA1123680.1 helix-turn-helix domain-containing protein [Mycobacterium shigaense]PRI12724.1 transcriptional regulator [Mycobacterium shigaense]BAX92657.1 putative transcriptional regulator [Mycobacterium shigaense]
MEFEGRLQDRETWSIGDACSMTKVLELLNSKTTFQVLRELFFGTTRFDDFVDRTGSSAPAVSRSLKQLEVARIVARTPYREPGRRARDEYRLTDAGEDLLPVFLSLVQWGDTHLRDGRGPLAFVHGGSGQSVEVRVTAPPSGAPLRSSDIRIRQSAQG